jgi:integrase
MAKSDETGRATRLTKRTVDEAEKQAARYVVWDDDLKGFGLRVEPSGAKTFIVRYRVGGGRRGTLRQYKVGRYGKLTPEKAREAAEKILARVELGQDPQAERVEERKTLTVSELCDLYVDEGMGTKKASTAALDKIRIERHIKPLIGKRRITDLSQGDIQRLMNDVASGKVTAQSTAHTRGGTVAATRTVGLLSGIFKFAIARRLCAENPAKGLKRFKDRKRERFLSPKELGALGDALTAAEEGGAHPSHIAILRLLSLTGARKNEIARLKWSEVQGGGSLLRLEDSKTGQKVIHLGAPAQKLLSELKPVDGSPYVFPDPRDRKLPIRNLDWAWVGIRNRAGLPDVRIHDLRHSFASVGIAGGSGLFLIGKLLGHSDVGTTHRYAHLADDPVKSAADAIAKVIDGQMRGKTNDPSPFKGKRS